MKYRVAIDGLLSEFDGGEALLLDLAAKRYHKLNRTGAFIWTLLEKGPLDETDIAEALVASHEVTETQAALSASRFVRELVALGLAAEV